MSGITSIGAANSNLFQLLAQADAQQSDQSLLTPASALLQVVSSDAEASATDVGASGSTSLQDQIQSAVSAALQSAEQSGSSDLKGTIYTTLVAVLKNNGIDPKTFKPTGSTDSSGGSQPVDSATSNVLAQVLTALSGATASSSALTRLGSSQDNSRGSSDLLSLLSTSRDDTGSSSSLSQLLALDDNQEATDPTSLLWASQNNSRSSGDLLSQFLSSQNNDQDLLGFLFDSGQ